MRNTDLVNFVGFSTSGPNNSTIKIRFAVDQIRRTKVLAKGTTDIVFYPLPHAMTKADAVKYIGDHTDPKIQEQVFQDAISKATKRLIPEVTNSTE